MEAVYNFEEIAKQFEFEGTFIKGEPYGHGHINSTFVLNFETQTKGQRRYILQKINDTVFKKPEKLMENIENVTNHIRNKVIANGGDENKEVLTLIKVKNGEVFYKDPSGNYWRAYIFIEGANTYQLVKNVEHFYSTGRAIGNFIECLDDFSAEQLYETIPDFHNTQKRYQDFLAILKSDRKGRAKEIQKEIQFVLDREEDTKVLTTLLEQKKIPLRVTHNDTKFNNVMIDDVTGEGVCIIDLDTVMPGAIHYDFGDAIRSGAATAEEDETDLSKVGLNMQLFENFAKGFIEATKGSLTEIEIEYLPFAAKLMTFECGMRFLSDYLDGDVYFKINKENHNLDRARNQFQLVEDIESKIEEMQEIVKKLKNQKNNIL